jgi:transposase
MLIAREQDATARAAWRAEMATIDAARLIFLDETSTPTTMTPGWGRSRRGERVVGRVPRRRWEAVTLLATLTPTGFGPGLQLDGAVDRQAFDTFVREALVPTLQSGDVVVLDNLSVHKSAAAQQAVEAVGARLVFLPAYTPDFNPIEQAFAKLKQGLRAAGARTIETVMVATQKAYPRITATDARGYYRHAGYFL